MIGRLLSRRRVVGRDAEFARLPLVRRPRASRDRHLLFLIVPTAIGVMIGVDIAYLVMLLIR